MCAVTIDGVKRILGAQGGRGMSVGWQRVSVCVNVCRAAAEQPRSGRIIHRNPVRRALHDPAALRQMRAVSLNLLPIT